MSSRTRGIPNVSIYKPKARSGPRHKWLVAYRENGKRKVESASTNYQVAQQYAMDVSRRLDRQRLGLISESDSRRAAAELTPVTDHVEQFHGWLLARGVTAKQAGEVRSRLMKLAEWCELRRLSDVSPSRVQAGVNDWRDENDRSAEVCNKYLKAAKQFSKWLWRTEKRITDHVLSDLTLYNVEADRRHVRRALTAEELAALLDAAEQGKPYAIGGMSGADRRMLYVLAAYTGLRRSELASLTPESFTLDADDPTVTLQAAYSKHRRTDVVPIRKDLAAAVRAWLVGRPVGRPVFAAMPAKAFLMLYQDLEAAGVVARTSEGVADFHALRHTFITLLGRTPGVSVKTVQQLARHTDIRLTSRYMHMQRHDELKALDGLPGLPTPPAERQRLRATGTDGGDVQRVAQQPPAPAQTLRLAQVSASPVINEVAGTEAAPASASEAEGYRFDPCRVHSATPAAAEANEPAALPANDSAAAPSAPCSALNGAVSAAPSPLDLDSIQRLYRQLGELLAHAQPPAPIPPPQLREDER